MSSVFQVNIFESVPCHIFWVDFWSKLSSRKMCLHWTFLDNSWHSYGSTYLLPSCLCFRKKLHGDSFCELVQIEHRFEGVYFSGYHNYKDKGQIFLVQNHVFFFLEVRKFSSPLPKLNYKIQSVWPIVIKTERKFINF